MRSVRFPVFLIVAASLLGVGPAPAATAAQPLEFVDLAHGASRGNSNGSGPFTAPLGMSLYLADTADSLAGQGETFWSQVGIDNRTATRIRETDWRHRFVFGVFSLWPTRGYDVRIRRITVQHIGGGAEQLCVAVERHGPPPGRVVLQQRTSVYDLVQVTRQAANLPAPESVVIRGIHGRLLYMTGNINSGGFNTQTHPVRPDVCHAS